MNPCGDGANGDEVVLSVPTEKPGQRPQYSWQYALQASKICKATCHLLAYHFPIGLAWHANVTSKGCMKFANFGLQIGRLKSFAEAGTHLKYCPMGVKAEQVSSMLPGS